MPNNVPNSGLSCSRQRKNLSASSASRGLLTATASVGYQIRRNTVSASGRQRKLLSQIPLEMSWKETRRRSDATSKSGKGAKGGRQINLAVLRNQSSSYLLRRLIVSFTIFGCKQFCLFSHVIMARPLASLKKVASGRCQLKKQFHSKYSGL